MGTEDRIKSDGRRNYCTDDGTVYILRMPGCKSNRVVSANGTIVLRHSTRQ